MYELPYFMEKDYAKIKSFIETHPFAVITGVDANHHPVATQIPLLITEKEGTLTFRAHLMRQTDHHKAFVQNPNVLVLFPGPHTYVSASWYSNPQQGSTWNYMTVHAKGVIHFLEQNELLDTLRDTTTRFEGAANTPGAYDTLPAAYIQQMAKAIVAFEITVTTLDAVFKLSQNRDEASYHNIIGKLKEGSADAQYIAAEMEQRTPQLFKSS